MNEALLVTELAAVLALPRGWLKAEAAAGRLPARAVGNVFLFDRAEVEAALRQRAGWAPGGGHRPVELTSATNAATPWSKKQFRTMLEAGEFPSFRIGTRLYVDQVLLSELVYQRELSRMEGRAHG